MRPCIRQALTISLVLAVAALLAYLLRELVARLVLEPVLYLLWILRLYYRIVPETIHWTMLLLVFLTAIWASQGRRPRLRSRLRLLQAERETRLDTWLSWIQARRQGEYSRWRLANRLALLTVEVIAQEQGVSPQQVRQAIEQHNPGLPEDLHEYLVLGLARSEHDIQQPEGQPLQKRWFISKGRQRTAEYEPDLLLSYLETKRGP